MFREYSYFFREIHVVRDDSRDGVHNKFYSARSAQRSNHFRISNACLYDFLSFARVKYWRRPRFKSHPRFCERSFASKLRQGRTTYRTILDGHLIPRMEQAVEVKRHESGSKVVGTYLSIRLARKREMESKEKIRGGGEGR